MARGPIAHAGTGYRWPESGTSIATLPDVSASSADSASAVGYQVRTPNGPTVTVIERWNGTSWTRVPSPDPGTCVTATCSLTHAMILHWNGRRWVEEVG